LASKKYPLHGAYLKITRASKHLDELKAALSQWFEKGEGYGTTIEEEPDGWQLFRCEIREDIPLGLGVVVGDIAHNLRSALDHLAWELVELDNGNPGKHTGFPIFTNPKQWKAKVEDPYYRPNKFKRLKSPLKGVRREVYDDIEKLQPYHRQGGFSPARQRLAELAWLNNADKHRALHVAYGVISDEEIRVEFDLPHLVLGVEKEILVEPTQLLEDGLELVRLRVTVRGDANAEPNAELVMPVGVVFAQEDGFVGYPSLIESINEVIDIIGRFDLTYFEGAGRPAS
jgi:hypothetical protein